ncbi:hypothetical protein E4665_17660 [Sporolactobacillus shoreae]|uniref:Phage gp6-like head-tail connector protein n=1 Tax=Sporolactobacillus shoreae TaxID=1465501 RepID=A0A4Z0GGQ4_9BACL|nr:head-tail connector protein [Sporolactobacillus shoreae]TGA95712.1 hypothetical protein E4665_17660 [Sporolactobacillus shoreae]
MTVTLPLLKNALRIDFDADDDQLTTYMNDAMNVIKSGVGTDENMADFWENNSTFDTAVIMLADATYKTRSAITDASNKQQVVEYPLGVTSKILKLKGSYLLELSRRPPAQPQGLATTDLTSRSVHLGWY